MTGMPGGYYYNSESLFLFFFLSQNNSSVSAHKNNVGIITMRYTDLMRYFPY